LCLFKVQAAFIEEEEIKKWNDVKKMREAAVSSDEKPFIILMI